MSQSTVRTYRIRLYIPNQINNFDEVFLSSRFSQNTFTLEYKQHKTILTKKNNQDLLITQDDYKWKWMFIYWWNHNIHKQWEIIVDENFYNEYFIPNSVNFFVFPQDNMFFLQGNKNTSKHFMKWFKDIYWFEPITPTVDLKKISENENNIKWVIVKPWTPNCDTLFWWWQDVQLDEKIREAINNPNARLSQLLINIEYQWNPIFIAITADCWIVIYKWNENLEDDLNIVFQVYNDIILRISAL